MHSFKELVQLFEERFTSSLPFPSEPSTLYDPCRYLLNIGGKRVRPVLCLMGMELFTELNDDAWNAASAIELFHNFTLIHDDIMDKAPLRRGHPTIHTKYGATAGILCGDVMNIFAYEQLAKISSGLPKVLPLFNKTAIEVCEGQQLDMDFELRNDVSMDEYINMITLKTSVLLACSLKMGALLGGSLGDNAKKLYSFGKNMGISFQLRDDYLDAYGDSSKTGKQTGGDIIENKKTFLLTHALANSDETVKNEIEFLLNYKGEDKVGRMMNVFSATGADVACRIAVRQYSDLAFTCLEEVAIQSNRKTHLLELANYLLKREM